MFYIDRFFIMGPISMVSREGGECGKTHLDCKGFAVEICIQLHVQDGYYYQRYRLG